MLNSYYIYIYSGFGATYAAFHMTNTVWNTADETVLMCKEQNESRLARYAPQPAAPPTLGNSKEIPPQL